jgi:hypothetical protein
VDLPLPLLPTSAQLVPAGIVSDSPCTIGLMSCAHCHLW